VSSTSAPAFRPWTVSAGRFEAQVAYLRNHGFTPLTVSELVALRKAGTLPPSPVVVTFDDGFSDVYTNALPILEEHDCSATLYITTGYVGGTSGWLSKLGAGDRPMLCWEQISALPGRGIECGAHTRSHPMLDTVSLPQAEWEIAGSKQALEQVLGRQVESFAYPHGYRSPRVKQLVAELGFTSACAVKHAISNTEDDPFDLARIVITADTTLPQFASMLEGKGVPCAPRSDSWKTLAWRQARRAARLLQFGNDRQPPAIQSSAQADRARRS
jgi:peptidoglycan/xylan/chitin deacetylase (PgdA/CDA1 family)